jgi:hypothetical protein
MIMLTNRIMGVFTFRQGVYAEVEHDTSFTQTAWILVGVVGFLNQLGAFASQNFLSWLVGALIGTVATIIGFAVAAFIISWAGRSFFSADVTFDEMVRTLGLAYVWNIIGVIGVLAAFSSALTCLLTPVTLISTLLGLIAWFIAAKEALDLEWVQTIATVVIGWVALLIIQLVAGGILALVGLSAVAIGA